MFQCSDHGSGTAPSCHYTSRYRAKGPGWYYIIHVHHDTRPRVRGTSITFLSCIVMKPLSCGPHDLMMIPFSCHCPHVHVITVFMLLILRGQQIIDSYINPFSCFVLSIRQTHVLFSTLSPVGFINMNA